MTTIVIADTTRHAKAIADGLAQPGAIATSPRSILRYYATRGLTGITAILVDESVPWPLDESLLTELRPHNAPLYRRHRP